MKTPSVEEVQLVSRFESLRKLLLSAPYSACLEKPLAYWALPTDRRLPLALLGRTLQELLHTPFADLSATPGIGQKKIRSFVKLLSRVANTDPAQLPMERSLGSEGPADRGDDAPAGGFDPGAVSEVLWSQWRASVLRHGLGGEALGRFAPSLRGMTRVIWNSPLEAYAGMTLAELRALKTHGEKRIQAILEAFHSAHRCVAGMGPQNHLVVRLVPRLIDRVETWVGHWLQTPGIPDAAETASQFVHPLLEQIRVDATRQIVALAENRLGIHQPATSVRQAARSMGLTRARVYQLLNEINDIMTVRWPLGRHQVYELRRKFEAEAAASACPPDLQQFRAALELFYPGSRRGAAGPLAHAGLTAPEFEDDADEEEPVAASGNGHGSARGAQSPGEVLALQTAN